jgi:hypothetical protein
VVSIIVYEKDTCLVELSVLIPVYALAAELVGEPIKDRWWSYGSCVSENNDDMVEWDFLLDQYSKILSDSEQ